MPSNKKRLYIALYPSGVSNNEERKSVEPRPFEVSGLTNSRYHWGFLIGPKNEAKGKIPGMRYHVKNNYLGGWEYEERPLQDVKTTISLLARILVAKVEDEDQLVRVLRGTPVIQGDPGWRCRSWVADALSRIDSDGSAVGTARLDWAKIEPLARSYVGEKAAAGRYMKAEDAELPKPTYDMLEEKEIVP